MNAYIFAGLNRTAQHEFLSGSIVVITKEICELFDMDISEIRGHDRHRRLVEVRQLIMLFLREHRKMTHKSIGNHFSRRDHSSVVYACQTAHDLIDTSRPFCVKWRKVCDHFAGEYKDVV